MRNLPKSVENITFQTPCPPANLYTHFTSRINFKPLNHSLERLCWVCEIPRSARNDRYVRVTVEGEAAIRQIWISINKLSIESPLLPLI
jgi:hypothetical protein